MIAMKVNKQIIVPIAALVSLILKSNFGIVLSDGDMDTVVNGVLAIVGLFGVFMHPKK